MPRISNNIKRVIIWINQLDEKKKESILTHFELNSLFRLQDNEIENLSILREFVSNLIIKEFDNAQVVEKLKRLGIDDQSANLIVENVNDYSDDYYQSNVVSLIDFDRFSNIIEFIINKVHLYDEYNYIPFSEFVEMFKFKNNIEAGTVLRFINKHITLVASRDVSLDTLKQMLIRQYNLPLKHTEVFIHQIHENLSEIRQAYLFTEIKKIKENMNDIIERKDDNL